MPRLLHSTLLFIVMLFARPGFAAEVEDSLGVHHFAQPAQRVVTLNWGATEEVIELGVTPVGIAEIQGYRDWVVRPVIKGDSVDVGTRAEPNIERIAELTPDLIVVGTMQRDMVERLSRIAPVLYFDNYRIDHDNHQAVLKAFRQLARALGRETAAEQRLVHRAARLEELKRQLHSHYGDSLPNVTAVRFIDTAHVRVYGDNSMAQVALQALGLASALPLPRSTWGQTQKAITDLAVIDDGILLYIEPFTKADALFSMPLWQIMPFVRNQHIAAVEPVWTYGGALSVQYLAEAFCHALLQLEP
ncbi:iron-siderophore ABC transporter substrate-binding protein [Marinobacterium rhizophilum]|uniref:ABC transporter substrate-binding protein n=1 Tax=Marinobacterium rhizophilum TaxID=420402 RepID=UPI000377AC7B|nr:iron-siderophore ABC transporter substrate-binding protein [Marinobacterium rhizophilum]